MKHFLPQLTGLWLVLALIGLNNTAAHAQNSVGVLHGKIADAETHLNLPGATVTIANTNMGTVSDIDGNFSLLAVPAGVQEVRISYMGYESSTQEIDLSAGETLKIDITLSPGVMLGDEIMVLGDRLKGQAKALNQQRANTNITNIVSADQIGRFPDANIGDAVKRIPGITVQNDQGEARDIIIRGMSPQLNSVMINGERVPSAEGDNRRVQLDLIPSDMIQTIEVNKAVTPDMDADAIGGAVNLITRSASNGLRVSGTLASGYNFLSEKPIWTGGLVLGDRFLDNKLGVVLSGSYNNHNFGSDNVEAEWDEGENIDAYVTELEYRKYLVQRVRRSVSASLDYQFNPNHKIYLKGIYNHRDDWENRFRLRYRDIGEPDENGLSESGEIVRQLKGGIGSDRIDNRRLEDQRAYNITLSGDHLLGSILKTRWSVTMDEASESRPNERYLEYTAQEQVISDGEVDYEEMAVEVRNMLDNPRKPNVVPTSEIPLDSYRMTDLTEQNGSTSERDINARLDFELPLNVKEYNTFLKFGGRLRLKTKERENNFFEYSPENEDAFNPMTQLPLEDRTDANYLPGAQYEVGTFVTPEYLGSLELSDTQQFSQESVPDEYVPGNFEATENIYAAYAMINHDFNSRLNVIAGVRMENTQLDYTGYQLVLDEEGDIDESQIVMIEDAQQYTNILPGIHAKYSFTPNSILRVAWTNTLARPNYYDLVPYRNVNIEDSELSEGNPELDPTLSMNLDANAETYFQSVGLVSGGVFYKRLRNFIYTYQNEDYIDPLTNQEFDAYYRPMNGENASVVGVEVALQRQLDFLPGALKGLGVYMNYTYTQSNANGIRNEDGEVREGMELPGTANHMLNASLSYETSKLVARVSLNYASSYLDEVGDANFTDRYYGAQTFLDANASYAFTPNLRFFVEANNLTNQPLRYYQGIRARTMQMEYYNVRFNAGFKFDLFEK